MNRKEYISVKKWSDSYIDSLAQEYPEKRIKIKNKYLHCKRTAKTGKFLCKSLKLEKQETTAAVTSCLLHDIGKIKQYSDKTTENHGIYGRKIIENSLILDNIHEKKYILNAVEFHNNPVIPDKIDKISNKYLKILRDADKLDLFFIITKGYSGKYLKKQWFEQINLPDTPCISKKIKISLKNKQTADYLQVKNNNDLNCLFLSWIYDINFKESFIMIKKMNITGKILRKLPEKEEYIKIVNEVNNFIKRQINGFNNSR
jgi:putative nucleotidyltransferase with HDIG domain